MTDKTIITLDFETYYDQDYTLRKMSTSEYVRDDRFEAISCAVKIGDNETYVYFGDDIDKMLRGIDWTKATLLAHHTHFDGLILSHRYGIVPSRYACTLSMARALHPKMARNDLESVARRYGTQNKEEMPDFKGKHLADLTEEEKNKIETYNEADVDVCRAVYDKMVKKFPDKELDLIDVTVRMFADPVLEVDMKLAKKEYNRERRDRAKIIKASGTTVDVLSSSKKFAEVLEASGATVPMKPSPSKPDKMIPALAKSDEDLEALLTHPDRTVVRLVEGRIAAMSRNSLTKAERMIARGKDGMKLPIYLNYAGAHTFRWSGGDKFNPQNFKQSKKRGGALRKAILAPKGHVLVVVDASQIEARVCAWLAEEEWVLDAFRQKRDLYCEFASDAYGRLITKEDKEERFVGKTCILGLGFQMGGPKLQTTLLTQSLNQGLDPVRLPLEVCYNLVNTFRRKCPNITGLWKFLNDVVIGAMISGKKMEFMGLKISKEKILLPNGLSLKYPGLKGNVAETKSSMFKSKKSIVMDASYETLKGRSKLYGGLLCENIVQALARIIVADAMLELSKKYRIVMMTHDEIVFIAKKKEADVALAEAQRLMARPPSWAPNLPLASEGGYDVCYSK